MRKMYFAMIPKRSFLEDVLITTGVVLGVRYGAKKLLGEEKYSEYVDKAKDFILGNTKKKEFDTKEEAAEVFGDEEGAPSWGDKSEEDILQRIKKAAEKGVRAGVDKIFGEEEKQPNQ